MGRAAENSKAKSSTSWALAFIVPVVGLLAYQLNPTLPSHILAHPTVSQAISWAESFRGQNIEPAGCESLIEYKLPRILPRHYSDICYNGWFPVELDSKSGKDELYNSLVGLFDAGRAFFDKPLEYKEQFSTDLGPSEGWSRVPGEKEMMTLHTVDQAPKELKAAAARAWASSGHLLNGYLEKMSEALAIEGDGLGAFSRPSINMDNVWKSAEIRVFRYEGDKPKIVSVAHKDLGMLSLVFGDAPGLEVWDGQNGTMIPIEKLYKSPTATVTMGRELEFLSNGKYPAGGHLVRAYGRNSVAYKRDRSVSEQAPQDTSAEDNPTPQPKYRHSIVFVLRAHWPVPVDLDRMTTPFTGPYKSLTVTDEDGVTTEHRKFTAGDLFAKLKGTHVNVNTAALEREKKRLKIINQAARAKAQAQNE